MNCPYCQKESFTNAFLPSARYNNKTFDYYKCTNCSLIFVCPIPDRLDLQLMYDTTYQNGIDLTIFSESDNKLPGLRFHYAKHFHLLNKFLPVPFTLLDYGCGNGNFIVNARALGIMCDGAEYNSDQVRLLQAELREASFFTIDDYLQNNIKHTAIRLSNVLEHLDNPKQTLSLLKYKLETSGILLIEGPLENNTSFASLIRKLYFKLFYKIANRKTEAAPYHITFSNYNNQINLFKSCGLTTLHYEVKENAWPYPENLAEIRSLPSFLKYIVAKISILICRLNPNSGNTFIYVGRFQ